MIRFTVLLLFIAFISTSCETSSRASRMAKNRYTGGGSLSNDDFSTDAARMVIFNVRLRMRVNEPDTLGKQLARMTKRYGGYVVTLGNEHATIRVPSAGMNSALLEIQTFGKITKKYISGQDVTDEFKDYEIRISNLSKARERYLELLARAENVEAALKVEHELERVNGEMETLKGKVEQIKHLSDFSTIDIAIEKAQKPGIIGYVGLGVYKAVRWLIIRN